MVISHMLLTQFYRRQVLPQLEAEEVQEQDRGPGGELQGVQESQGGEPVRQ